MNNYKSRLLKLFVPIMLSNLINQLQMLIDRIFLGRMDVLYMSAVGNASNLMWTTMAVVFSLGIGASILISQSVGEGNQEKVQEYAGALLKFNSILPLILFVFWMFFSPVVFGIMGVSDDVLEYCVTYVRFFAPIFLILGLESSFIVILQTSNYTKHLVTFGIIRSALNIVLDYALIFGKFGFPRMELAGAALATTIAEFAGIAFCSIIFVKSKKLPTRPTVQAIIKAKFSTYFNSAKLGLNTALEDFAWNFGNLGMIRILNSINKVGAGIYSIVFSFEIIAVAIIASIGQGTMTLCGEATGANDEKQFKKIVKTAFQWSTSVAAFTFIMTLLFPQQLFSIFTTDKAVITTSSIYLSFMGFNLFGKCGNIIFGNGIRGFGNTKWMFFTQIFGTVSVLSLGCLFVYVFKWQMTGVYLAVITDELIRAVINGVKFFKIKFKNKVIAAA